MVKQIIPQRFSKQFLDAKTLERFGNYLGPISNFYGAGSIEYLNLRIFITNNQKYFKIVNDHNHKFNYVINEFVKSFFRTYSDGIFTNDSHVLKNREDDFEVNYEAMQLDKSVFFSLTPRADGKKSVGIMSSDLNKNLMQKHKLFLNENMFKYLLLKKQKFDKFKESLEKENFKDLEIKPLEKFNCKEALELFVNESKCKLTFLEGLGDQSLKYLQLQDPVDIPSDIVVAAFVKDGEFGQEEISRPFNIWDRMEPNFVKLYQSKKLMGDDGSTWFFAVFKKRMLIQKNREVLNLEQENPLFDDKTFKNYF